MLVLWGNGDISIKLETMKPSAMLSGVYRNHYVLDMMRHLSGGDTPAAIWGDSRVWRSLEKVFENFESTAEVAVYLGRMSSAAQGVVTLLSVLWEHKEALQALDLEVSRSAVAWELLY